MLRTSFDVWSPPRKHLLEHLRSMYEGFTWENPSLLLDASCPLHSREHCCHGGHCVSTHDINIDDRTISEWLEDLAARVDYGSATLTYDVAAALVTARKMKKLTQTALATRAGVRPAYIAKLERGEANPTIGRIGAILAAMGFKADIHIMPIVARQEPEVVD
jgi:DNA-binding XRE family transcriptional regulator